MAIFGDFFKNYCSRFFCQFFSKNSEFVTEYSFFKILFEKWRKVNSPQYIYITALYSQKGVFFLILKFNYRVPNCEISPKKIPEVSVSAPTPTTTEEDHHRPICLLDRSLARCNCFWMLWMLVMCYVYFPILFLLLLQTKDSDLSMCQFGVVWKVQSPPRPLLLLLLLLPPPFSC